MRRHELAAAAGALVLLMLPSPVSAQRLDLSLSPRVITFPSADPDAVPLIAAAPVQVTYRVRQNDKGAPWSLTVLAGGDLMSGPARIDISNVTWVATPAPPFQNGTLSKTVAQRIASGSGNLNPTATGSITFRLANSWTYSTGTYSQTVLFTLSVP
jgi:hypothetical protein